MKRLALAGCITLLAACSHSDAFAPHDTSRSGPLVAGTPARLTYNPTASVTPAWLPDASAFAYGFSDLEARLDHDQCIGIMPAAGGSLTGRICNVNPFSGDSTDTFAWPAVSPNGTRLAYLRSSRPRAAQTDQRSTLVVASLAAPASFTPVRSLPFQGGDGTFYVSLADLSWLGPEQLVMLGEQDNSVSCPDPPACTEDPVLVRSGRRVLVATLAPGAPTVVDVLGTDWASSVAPVSGSTDIYYTVAGASQVYRAPLTGGGSVVHDFGAEGIARDVDAAGNRLVAVAGVVLRLLDDGSGAPLQQDFGGRLFVVNLAAGTSAELAIPATVVRHPAIAPDGSSVVAEGYALTITRFTSGGVQFVDTAVTGVPTLWRFPLQ